MTTATEELIAKDEGKGGYTPHPSGQWTWVCADVHDEGMKKDEWQGQVRERRVVRLVFQSEVINEATGHSFEHSEWFTLSLHEKAKLRAFLESWRGQPFTEEEAKGGWNIMRLLGANCYVQVAHVPKQSGGIKAKITSIMALPKGMARLKVAEDFVRVKDRVKKEDEVAKRPPALEDEDDDLPF